jgi:hypothetical protein
VRLEFACLRRPSHALYYVRLVRLFGAAPGWLTKARKGVCLDSNITPRIRVGQHRVLARSGRRGGW